jgi:arabinan endo-1,5-alpha-L-arabinosidase
MKASHSPFLSFSPATAVALFAVLITSGFTCSAPAQPGRPQNTNAQFRMDEQVRVHDPSTLVRDGETFWTFSTGTGIRSLYSSNLVQWQFSAPVLTPATTPAWHQRAVPGHRGHLWAPDVIQVDGRWLLYYSVSTWGKNTSAIGLLTNATLNPADPRFGWRDAGVVIASMATNNYNTIDPAAFRDVDGRLWLSFGSFWSGLKLVELDPRTGLRLAPNSPLRPLAHKDKIEAPFLHRRDTNYFLFLNWGQCCQGTNSTYEIRVGRAERITGPYRDRDGVELLSGGGTLVLNSAGRFIGPGHAGIIQVGNTEWFSFHYYDGENRGRATLGLRKLTWDAEGWPVVTEATPGGPVQITLPANASH